MFGRLGEGARERREMFGERGEKLTELMIPFLDVWGEDISKIFSQIHQSKMEWDVPVV